MHITGIDKLCSVKESVSSIYITWLYCGLYFICNFIKNLTSNMRLIGAVYADIGYTASNLTMIDLVRSTSDLPYTRLFEYNPIWHCSFNCQIGSPLASS